jgi:hypothetical protein
MMEDAVFAAVSKKPQAEWAACLDEACAGDGAFSLEATCQVSELPRGP